MKGKSSHMINENDGEMLYIPKSLSDNLKYDYLIF